MTLALPVDEDRITAWAPVAEGRSFTADACAACGKESVMSSISGISAGSASLFELLKRMQATQSNSGTSVDSTSQTDSVTGPKGPGRGPGPSPEEMDKKFEQGLEAQGYSGTELSDLMSKIQDAATAAMQNTGDSTGGKGDVRSAVEQVLKDAGVDVEQFNEDIGVGNEAPPDGAQGQPAFVQTLKEQGITMSEFFSRLQTAIGNSDGQTLDLSQLLTGISVGSEIDVTA
jgi:hypothetical protein